MEFLWTIELASYLKILPLKNKGYRCLYTLGWREKQNHRSINRCLKASCLESPLKKTPRGKGSRRLAFVSQFWQLPRIVVDDISVFQTRQLAGFREIFSSRARGGKRKDPGYKLEIIEASLMQVISAKLYVPYDWLVLGCHPRDNLPRRVSL